MGTRVAAGSSVAFFFDKSVGKKVPTILRSLGVDVTIHDEVYSPRARVPDETWIARASADDQVIVSRDKNIRRKPAERDAFVRGNARVFLLSGKATSFHMLRTFLAAWKKILVLLDRQPAPFIHMIDDDGRVLQRYPE